jgi:hypothetical protein
MNTVFLSAVPSKIEARRRVLDAIALKRRQPHLSMTAAAKRSGTTLRTVKQYAADALEIRSGRLDAKRIDKLRRNLRFFTDAGQVEIVVSNSRDARRIALYHNALRRFLVSGDDSRLKKFAGKSVRADGGSYRFVTDHRAINRLARAGEIHFLDIYASPEASL